MPFTDLHLHPSLKTQFSDRANPITPCHTILPDILPGTIRLCSDFPAVFQSQCNLTQLHQNNVKLICTALYAPEPALFQDRAKLLIKLSRGRRMGQTLNEARLQEFIDPGYSPFTVLKQELAALLSPCGNPVQQLNVLNNRAEFDETNADVFTVFSVEGCHSLVNSLADFADLDSLPNVIMANLQELRTVLRLPVIAINLIHMQQFSFCNHAFGMQFLDNDAFLPGGFGVSEAGFEVAQRCMAQHILIDIKHMSMLARQQFYARQSGAGFPTPIICTHAGFSGIKMGELRNFVASRTIRGNARRLEVVKPKKYLSETTFNATSISLFDEDIEAILRSGGIIGLSMDSRILGYNPTHPTDEDINAFVTDEDVFSRAEFDVLFRNLRTPGSDVNQFRAMQNTDVSDLSKLQGSEDNKFLHVKHIINHLVHLMVVGQRIGIAPLQALKHVCLGSDFDGMISPVSVAPTIGSYSRLRDRVKSSFLTMINEANRFNPGLNLVIPANQVETIMEDVFYRNGRDFILNRIDLL
jgi:microsomal dipeptidase-like Zn-dependent dipeptidase